MACNSEEKYIQKLIIECMTKQFNKLASGLKFDRTVRGKVISISSDYKSAIVSINDTEKTCYCSVFVGKNIKIGEVVSVTYESGSTSFPRIRL